MRSLMKAMEEVRYAMTNKKKRGKAAKIFNKQIKKDPKFNVNLDETMMSESAIGDEVSSSTSSSPSETDTSLSQRRDSDFGGNNTVGIPNIQLEDGDSPPSHFKLNMNKSEKNKQKQLSSSFNFRRRPSAALIRIGSLSSPRANADDSQENLTPIPRDSEDSLNNRDQSFKPEGINTSPKLGNSKTANFTKSKFNPDNSFEKLAKEVLGEELSDEQSEEISRGISIGPASQIKSIVMGSQNANQTHDQTFDLSIIQRQRNHSHDMEQQLMRMVETEESK